VFTLLARHGAAYCVMSGAGLPCVLRATARHVYVRLHGPDPHHLYAGSYGEADLRWWAARIAEWARAGHDVHAYFNNDGEGHAVRNAARLREDGARIVDPGSGELASKGERGDGRLAEPEELLAAIEEVLAGPTPGAAVPTGPRALGPGGPTPSGAPLEAGEEQDLAGLDVLVSAGGTREPIDAVRFVGNRSSGRMGYAVAARAAARGARVTVVAANVGLADPEGCTVVRVSTAEELRAACAAAFSGADVLVMAAAVADFRPVDPADGKIKKQGRTGMTIELEATVDVLVELSGRRRPGQILVGFAAEHGDQAVAHAREKLVRKGLDAVVVNDVSQPGIAFDAADNAVTIVTAAGDRTVARAAKADIADAILDDVVAARRA
jgi:phosphopantothenoylcysteine decarboxylase/phosphopantothenate--cysteine ligase